MYFLYRLTNQINQKVYIGQTDNIARRWREHKSAVRKNKPTQIIHKALIKYGIDKFDWDIIATCQIWENANELETLLVTQYDCHISTGKGYNLTYGGYNAPKTEEFKEMMKQWHASLSDEEKLKRSERHREVMTQYIEENGHPGLGTKRTPEQLENLRKARATVNIIYTPELRQKMSEAHIGYVQSEEAIRNRVASFNIVIQKRHELALQSGEIRCNAPSCDINGFDEYYTIYDGVRYCSKHGSRLKRNGTLQKLPMVNTFPKGNVPHNKIIFSEEDIKIILNDKRGAEKVGKDFGVCEKVILRVRKENSINNS